MMDFQNLMIYAQSLVKRVKIWLGYDMRNYVQGDLATGHNQA